MRAAIGPPLITTIGERIRLAGLDPETEEGAALLTTAVAAYRTRYAEVGFDLTRPVPGMVELLERLRDADHGTTVIVTAKPAAVAEPLLAHLGLRDAFDAVHGAPMGPEVEEKRVTLARALATTRTSGTRRRHDRGPLPRHARRSRLRHTDRRGAVGRG